jgi:hypothetical protein
VQMINERLAMAQESGWSFCSCWSRPCASHALVWSSGDWMSRCTRVCEASSCRPHTARAAPKTGGALGDTPK